MNGPIRLVILSDILWPLWDVLGEIPSWDREDSNESLRDTLWYKMDEELE